MILPRVSLGVGRRTIRQLIEIGGNPFEYASDTIDIEANILCVWIGIRPQIDRYVFTVLQLPEPSCALAQKLYLWRDALVLFRSRSQLLCPARNRGSVFGVQDLMDAARTEAGNGGNCPNRQPELMSGVNRPCSFELGICKASVGRLQPLNESLLVSDPLPDCFRCLHTQIYFSLSTKLDSLTRLSVPLLLNTHFVLTLA